MKAKVDKSGFAEPGKFASTSPPRPYRFSINLSDHVADTVHLSATEQGAYMRLLFSYWRSGPLRDDDKTLARITGMTEREWSNVRQLIKPFFDVQGGTWIHWRLDQEIEAAYKAINGNRDRTAAATAARKQQRNDQRHDQRNVAHENQRNVVPTVIKSAQAPSQGLNSSNSNDLAAAVYAAEIDLGARMPGGSV